MAKTKRTHRTPEQMIADFEAKIALVKERAAAKEAKAAPAPEGSEQGLISDFEGEGLDATFGAGWQPSTDEMVGGESRVTLARVSPGGGVGRHSSVRRPGVASATVRPACAAS